MAKNRNKRRKGQQRHQLVLSDNGTLVRLYGNDRGTAERWAHEPGGMRVVETIVGKQRALAGRAGDTIGRLLTGGSISLGLAKAARSFHSDFHAAALDPLRAAPLQRHSKGVVDDTAVLAARDQVAGALAALGGHGSQAARAVWWVAGVGYTIRDWAQRERFGNGRPLNEYVAKGILIGALYGLRVYYDETLDSDIY